MNFLDDLLFFIYPKSCGICKKIENNFLCEKCERKLKTSELFVNQIIDYEKDRTKYFDEHAFVFKYDSIIRDKIIQYKFNNKAYLSKMFFEFFVKNKKICGFLKKYDIIIPVPMTYKKIKERGYNQTQLIARLITENIESLALKEDILIKYKDKYFHLFADKVSRNAVLADSYMIWTNSEQLAQEYIFEKKEQFVFIKYITRKEIGAVKIVKTPVLDFKDIEQSEEIIEGDALDSWLSELI